MEEERGNSQKKKKSVAVDNEKDVCRCVCGEGGNLSKGHQLRERAGEEIRPGPPRPEKISRGEIQTTNSF